jgi:hypothetical protein
MSEPMTMHRSFSAEVDGLGRLEWNVELCVTCPKCGNKAGVNSSEGGTRVICDKCSWSADTLIDAFRTISLILRQAP